jgi:hypothetical protein
MFRTFSFVLALVLCTSGWSMAHAAPRPQLVQSLGKTVTGGWLYKDGAIHFNEPFKTNLPFKGAYENDKINFPSLRGFAGFVGFLGWPFATCETSETCKHYLYLWFGGNNDHKDAD